MYEFGPVYDLSVKNILLGTDFSPASDAAFHAVLKLCLEFNARLHILNVFEYDTLPPSESDGVVAEFDSFRQRAEFSLDSLVQDARRIGIPCEGSIEEGIPDLIILEAANTKQVDLIALGTRPIHGFERLVFGSTAEAVLRQARCPVFTVGPRATNERSSGGTIVFATDFHSATLNALYSAVSFSKKMRLPLHCLNVLPRGLERNSDRGTIPAIVTEALRHLVSEVDGEVIPPVCAVTYGSEISTAVVEYAKRHNAELIVLGVRKSSLAASHIPAHIAYRVIAEAPCPVLTTAYSAPGSPPPVRLRPSSVYRWPNKYLKMS